METQQTIGYGLRVINVYCPEAVVTFIFHALVGLTLSSVFTGLFFARFANQGNVGTTLKFSHKALITMRNGELYFVFRVADIEVHLMNYFVVMNIAWYSFIGIYSHLV
jgi:potassium inwardly-rectifying channel subfamily J protein 4